VLVSSGAEERRPVASLTKLVTALAMTTESPDMDREVCIGFEEQPSWPGTTTRLGRGTCAAGWDMIGAALVRSDNGAARSLVQVSGLPLYPFVQRMNQVAADLGMDQSSFTGPTGVEDDNLSTARDMTRAVYAASQHPTLAPVLNSTYWEVSDARRGMTRRMFSTNRLKWDSWLEFVAAKTGYTDTAKSCFSTVVRVNGRRTIALTMLGAKNGKERWAELRRILRRIARSQM
jgi:D-alanyl-D-alanine endopeptidase (penicillin-binding protein 7)